MFISDKHLSRFTRDICAMANIQPSGELECVLRGYCDIIEFLQIGDDAESADAAFYDQMSMLAMTATRVVHAESSSWMPELQRARSRAGMQSDAQQPDPVIIPPLVESSIHVPVSPVEDSPLEDVPEFAVEEECINVVEESLITNYSEGTQIHEAMQPCDSIVPVATWDIKYIRKPRRGKKRIIKKFVKTDKSSFDEYTTVDQSDDIHSVRHKESTRLKYDYGVEPFIGTGNLQDRRVFPHYTTHNIRELERALCEVQERNVLQHVLQKDIHNCRIGIDTATVKLLLRHCSMDSKRKPSVKMKRYLSILFN